MVTCCLLTGIYTESAAEIENPLTIINKAASQPCQQRPRDTVVLYEDLQELLVHTPVHVYQ
jgi:hypothetical protein